MEQFFGTGAEVAAIHALAGRAAVRGLDELGGVLAEAVALASIEGALVERLVEVGLELAGGGLHGGQRVSQERQRGSQERGQQNWQKILFQRKSSRYRFGALG